MWIWLPTGLCIKVTMPGSRCAEDSYSKCTIWYKPYINHCQSVWPHVRGGPEYSHRRGQYTQKLRNLHILLVRFGSILETTIHSSGYSWIVFHNLLSIQEHRWSSLGAPESPSLCIQPIWEYLGASGRISVAVQSCWVVRLWLPNRIAFRRWSYMISASKCLSILSRYWPPSAALSYMISAFEWMSKVTLSQSPSASLSHLISATKCISKLTRSWPPSASLSCTRSWPPSEYPNSLHCGLQVPLPVHTIMASKCISTLSQSASPGAPAIALQYHLQPDRPYVYI